MALGSPRARYLLALLVAAVIGFALGWIARQGTTRDAEEQAREAAAEFLRKLGGDGTRFTCGR